ncbi:hypothetical protein [Thermomonas fusca]|uniref:hypothetical protein n=1 Tax=Thermomonas fusca TaxID=215690 RepID=UPI001FECDC85|nr:hypothetical protein [Thermomonas fusca]
MFFIGTKSMIVAAGIMLDMTRFSGVTTSAEGATPNEQVRMAPLTTWIGMARPQARGLSRQWP